MTSNSENFISEGRKIVAIGRSYTYNWPGNQAPNPLPEPLLFIKPTTSYVSNGKAVEIPKGCEVYHEVELAVVIGKEGKSISLEAADDYIAGYALALDMTARNVQTKAREGGLPWTICKGMDTFTPISNFIPKALIPDPGRVDLLFKINDDIRQSGSTSGMIYTISQLVAFASSVMTLQPGDTILTGTPDGVGRFYPGEHIRAELSYEKRLLASLDMEVKQLESGYEFIP